MAASPRHRSKPKSKAKNSAKSHQKATETVASSTDIVFGRHSVLSCLEQGRPLDRIWLVASLQKDSRFQPLLQQAKQQGTVIQKTDPQHLHRLSQGGNHQGIVAQMAAYQYQDLEELVAAAKAATDFPVLVAADGVTDPHNLGAIARTAEAFRTQGVIIPQRRSASVCATVAKVAAGALENLAIARVVNLNRALDWLKEEGFWIYGTAVIGSVPIHEVRFTEPTVLVVGSEGSGISSLTQKRCDTLVSIPLSGKTQSLNVSVATGIALYEIYRQHFGDRL
ncbi:23S rRNA (guanosine(2251)-2'-O)-methyltransferase RlmB [Geitlerinema sp. PCC 9228]|jgi:23S rRNA (guanosine2251-2'-O)-methyltransferase|uniref:23S rRNA (guanosine(2251)-2'-O)-methyltransferase RlmB n=1 Tax=Geitlerinema sp. PCC 9228 TaxID=111611 RepID=UPI0008F98FE4|nr:23S rRNA (guanosine(2251)-2'-O)-methyltransferase RlmB [Geitlerinema sp. PCC 9228]